MQKGIEIFIFIFFHKVTDHFLSLKSTFNNKTLIERQKNKNTLLQKSYASGGKSKMRTEMIGNVAKCTFSCFNGGDRSYAQKFKEQNNNIDVKSLFHKFK